MRSFLIFLLTGATLWVASCANTSHQSLGPGPGGAHEAKKVSSLTVMAYNIHHCNPPSKPGLIDLEAIVNTIRKQAPDLVALQEVDVRTERSGGVHQAEEIAKRLNMHFFFGKAIDFQDGEYGVALLSRYPLSEAIVHRLPTKAETKGEPRVLATAKVTLPDGTTLRFGSTHLDAQRDSVNRELQIGEIVKVASAEPLPFLLAGDFNATPGTGTINLLDQAFTRTCQECAPTIPVLKPTKAIDFIAYRHPGGKFSVSSHKVIPETYASDHLPVTAIIRVQK
ncbi:endonuclease/exonuclease/phosphatase family protein [Rufibacter immobilis]|uniref:endonuclease/exonuclease/phosphatase family protein n=1 Tax=Rufibacter immobilis TaxID=1348778 RepID=UPI0035ED7DF3